MLRVILLTYHKWLQIDMNLFRQQFLQLQGNIIKISLQSLNLLIQFLLFYFRCNRSFVHLVQWQSNNNTVEKYFIKTLNSLFQSDFLFQFFHFLLFCRFDDFPVYPMLGARILSTKSNKETIEKSKLFFSVFFLSQSQHWFCHSTNDQCYYFLKRQPEQGKTYIFDSLICDFLCLKVQETLSTQLRSQFKLYKFIIKVFIQFKSKSHINYKYIREIIQIRMDSNKDQSQMDIERFLRKYNIKSEKRELKSDMISGSINGVIFGLCYSFYFQPFDFSDQITKTKFRGSSFLYFTHNCLRIGLAFGMIRMMFNAIQRQNLQPNKAVAFKIATFLPILYLI